MNELDPQIIGTPIEAQQLIQRLMMAAYRAETTKLLDKAQAELDRFNEMEVTP